MNQNLFQQIYGKLQQLEAVPPNEEIAGWATKVIGLLYPAFSDHIEKSVEEMETHADVLRHELTMLLNATKACRDCDNAATC